METNINTRSTLAALIASGETTQAQIASECGISKATVSLFLSGKYTGDNTTIEQNLSAFIVRYKSASDQPLKHLPFVSTAVSRMIHEVASTCHTSGLIGLVVGASGLGKTRSIKEYESQNPGVIVIPAHAKYATKDVFSDIHSAVGYDGRGNVHRMMNDIVIKLKGTRRLIVIDEAEHLTANTLDEIRQINDRADVGVLYVGLEKFRSQLRSMRTGYEYIVNRVRVPAKVTPLKFRDVEALVKSVMPNANGLCNDFFEASGGNARILETILFNVFRMAAANKSEIDSDMIRQAATHIIV